MSESIDFSGVDSAEGAALGGKYLTPGMYRIQFTEATHGKSGLKNTPYMEVKFVSHSKSSNLDGKEGRAKFYLTAGALPRIQYFHAAFFGKKLDKKFNSTEEIVQYFDAVFKSDAGKKLIKPCIVAGSISADGSKIYSDLPYTGWVCDENSFEEGAFDFNTPIFKNAITSNVKVYKPDTPSSGDDLLSSPETPVGEVVEKMPWE